MRMSGPDRSKKPTRQTGAAPSTPGESLSTGLSDPRVPSSPRTLPPPLPSEERSRSQQS